MGVAGGFLLNAAEKVINCAERVATEATLRVTCVFRVGLTPNYFTL
jgi:hypothetical protein